MQRQHLNLLAGCRRLHRALAVLPPMLQQQIQSMLGHATWSDTLPGGSAALTSAPAAQGAARQALQLQPSLLAELSSAVSGRLTTAAAVLAAHGKDESYHTPVPPQAVVFPHTTEEVSKVVSACTRAATPVVPYGTGTSLEGHIAALHGGVCLDLSQMNQVLEVNAEDLDCRVEAGVTRCALNDHLHDSGLFFPVDPGADASLGGMAATRASGTNAVRYGTMRDNVLGLTVVLPDGAVARTGHRVRKSAAGYDLTALMVGSEGTLGIMTELALRLYGQPESVAAAVCEFPEMRGAADTAVAIMQTGIPVARMELLDALTITALNAYSKTSFSPAPTMFFEFHGSAAGVMEQSQAVGSIAQEMGASGFRWAHAPEERARLWAARHSAYWASLALRPGCLGFPTDVCVPISRLTECILAAQRLCQGARLVAPLVGHVGDGNFHLMLLVDPADAGEVARARACVRDMVHLALGLGGTCTGEHGVGYGKLEFLEAEHGAVPLRAMHAIKAALDPTNIMNPAKLGSSPDSFAAIAALVAKASAQDA